MTWALLNLNQERVLRHQFESLLKLKLEEDTIALSPAARDAMSRLQAKIGIRMLCHKARKYLEYTKCRDLNQTFIALDRE